MNTGWRYVVKQFSLLGLVALLCLFFLALGLVIGYGVIGDEIGRASCRERV